MKPTTLRSGRLLLAFLVLGTCLALVSWDLKQSTGRHQQPANDTVPKTKSPDREKKIRDLDDVLDELNSVDLKVDMEKIQKEIAQAMKKIDGEKIRLEVEKAMKGVDMAKIQKEVQESLAKVDFDKIKAEIADAMKEVDMAKIQKEVQESLAKVDWDKIKTEMDKAKEIDMKKLDADMKKLEEELKKIGPEIEKGMEKARVEIEKAKTEMKEYKEFVDGLEKDGLINKKEPYSIKHKNGELTVNDKKVSKEVYSKYRGFLGKHKIFTIEKSDDDFNIDID